MDHLRERERERKGGGRERETRKREEPPHDESFVSIQTFFSHDGKQTVFFVPRLQPSIVVAFVKKYSRTQI